MQKNSDSACRNKKKKNVANMTASNLSKKPPWPGKICPESLMFACRFKNDSKMSPKNAKKQVIEVIKNNNGIDKYKLPDFVASQKVKKAPINPPMHPSTVFPGLIFGMIL